MISFKNVNKWFGDLHVLTNINLEVEKGEVVVVCGPSGSGKSTLIRCINRLEPIQEGELVVDGMKVHDKKTNMTQIRFLPGNCGHHTGHADVQGDGTVRHLYGYHIALHRVQFTVYDLDDEKLFRRAFAGC